MTTFLKSQRKVDLVEMADEAGLSGASSMRKDELASALDQHLRANASTLAGKPKLKDYYGRHTSPKRSSAAPADDDSKPPKAARRRTTTVLPADTEKETQAQRVAEATASAAHETPRAIQRVASRVGLPPSPAAVTDVIERQTNRVRRRVTKYWKATGVTPHLETVRVGFSSVVAIQSLFLALEAYGLQKVTLPWKRTGFYVPALPAIGMRSQYNIESPDFFLLVTSTFWAPTTLWTFTSLFLPLIAAWVCNLSFAASQQSRSHRRSSASGGIADAEVDPLVFHITKAVISWLVYSQGFRFGGLIADHTVATVQKAVPGGWFGIVLASVIGSTVSIYDAVLKK